MKPAELEQSTDPTQVLPGAWIGVFGGGQLGRMFAHAAQRLGYRIAVFDFESAGPASQVADQSFCVMERTGQSPESIVVEFANRCEVVGLEFENIPSSLVRLASERTRTRPTADFLEICQDRVLEKQSLARIGCPTTPFVAVTTEQEASLAGQQLGWPLVLKTARSGYDGKGQSLVRLLDDLPGAWTGLDSSNVIAEQWIDFVAEVSMITARNARGQVVSYPLIENQHANHILDLSECPVRPELLTFQSQAEEISRAVADAYSVVGLFCIEFFVTRDGRLIVNEIAPRPHNSGHLTIEAFDISQFEMQVRSVCNLPLRIPVQHSPAAMVNLLGDLWQSGPPNWESALERPNAFLHLYGKSSAKPGRKMGHITVLDASRPAEIARNVRDFSMMIGDNKR